MALESFYGGQPGVSPVIKASFKYVNIEDPAYQVALRNNGNDAVALKPYTMDECFKNVEYTDVWYGELCIIDTQNKMNPNNGKIYRRTLKNFDDERWTQAGNTLYAEYVGQIVGPSGGIPNLDLGSLDEERQKAVGISKTYDTDGNLPLDTTGWDYSYRDSTSGLMTNENPEGDYSKIQVLDAGGTNGENIEMVPGKDGNTYHDTIKYTWCNVRRNLDNSDEDAWIYLGFQIPYTVYDATGQEENYTYNGNIFVDQSPANHPFYKNWVFHIPRGTRGIGPEQLFIVGKDNHEKPSPLYNFDAIGYRNDNGQDTYYIQNTTLINPTSDTYWVAKWVLYNPKTGNTTPQTVYQYLGDYKDVTGVRLLNNGSLQIQYSDNDNWLNLNQLTWITSASVISEDTDANYGNFNISFNNNSISNINANLHLIKAIAYSDRTGQIRFDYSGNISKTVGTISYISKMRFLEDGSFQYQLNNENNIWHTITNTGNESDSEAIPFKIKDLKTMFISNDGHLWATYRNNTSVDLGSVKRNIIASIVYTVKNTNNLDGTFESENAALNDLKNKVFDSASSTTIGGDNDGRIRVNNEDVTGGLVSAKIKPLGNTDYYAVLFYYDSTDQAWINGGSIGGNSGGKSSNIYIIGPKNSYTNAEGGTRVYENGITYPATEAENPEIYFADSRIVSIPEDPSTEIPSPDLPNLKYDIIEPPNVDDYTI